MSSRSVGKMIASVNKLSFDNFNSGGSGSICWISRQINSMKHVLFVKEQRITKKNYNKWGLPGGETESNETGVETLMRELKEEINFDPAFTKNNAIFLNRCYIRIVGEELEDFYVDVFKIASIDYSIVQNIKLSDEHSELKWVPVNDIYSLTTRRALLQIMDELDLWNE
eukprot:390909_1